MIRVGRALRHWFTLPHAVRRAFPHDALERIRTSIADSERLHSGEIRFAVEGMLPWSYLWRDAPARQRAAMVFSKLRVWDTEQNNGVLIYVELADRCVELVADRGIAQRVPRARWEAVAAAMRDEFRAGRFESGVLTGVQQVGALLTEHYPLAAGEHNPNQLSDKPVML